MNLSLIVLAGMLVAFGVATLVAAAVPAAPRLDDALARAGATPIRDRARADVGVVTTRSDRLGALLYRRLPTGASERQLRQLRLQGRSIAEFYGDKAALAIIGAVLPAVVGAVAVVMIDSGFTVPAVAALIGLVVGWFVPDWQLHRGAAASRSGAVEALLTYVDLVTLERLANASATQALHSAAAVSDTALFRQIRVALGRARLEQHSPYGELRRLAEEMNLPELADIADVMQLDETGAALSGALRARVKELRDAHQTDEQVAAVAAAEGMTIYMTVPALIFGLIFLVAALLRIIAP